MDKTVIMLNERDGFYFEKINKTLALILSIGLTDVHNFKQEILDKVLPLIESEVDRRITFIFDNIATTGVDNENRFYKICYHIFQNKIISEYIKKEHIPASVLKRIKNYYSDITFIEGRTNERFCNSND